MKGRVREDILEYLKSAQYVSEFDALEHVHPFDDQVESPEQFEADFDTTLNWFLLHVEQIGLPPESQ